MSRMPAAAVALGLVLCGCVPNRPYRFKCPSGNCGVAKGLTLIIHGGGWQDDGKEPTDELTTAAESRWLARGFATLAFSYRPSTEGPMNASLKAFIDFLAQGQPPNYPVIEPGSAHHAIEDARAFYAQRSDIVGAALAAKPTCVVGFSAGGHLALEVAAAYPEIRCVVSDAGPTNLADAPLLSTDPDPRELGWVSGAYGELAFGAPGPDNASGVRAPEFSPAKLAAQNAYAPGLQVLLGSAPNDPWVRAGHARDFASARPTGTRVFELTAATSNSSVRFVHSDVTVDSLAAYRQVEDDVAQRALVP